jgi:predicted nucleic acid-binding protein
LILIDSYGWIEYFGEGPLADNYAPFIEKADEKGTVTPTIIMYEVYKKIRSVRGEEKALEAYAQMSRTRIVELTTSLCLEAADLSINLKLGMADAIIAATAKAYDAQIVTSDKHLRNVDKDKVINNQDHQHVVK